MKPDHPFIAALAEAVGFQGAWAFDSAGKVDATESADAAPVTGWEVLMPGLSIIAEAFDALDEPCEDVMLEFEHGRLFARFGHSRHVAILGSKDARADNLRILALLLIRRGLGA